jgi:hypothetical protein
VDRWLETVDKCFAIRRNAAVLGAMICGDVVGARQAADVEDSASLRRSDGL